MARVDERPGRSDPPIAMVRGADRSIAVRRRGYRLLVCAPHTETTGAEQPDPLYVRKFLQPFKKQNVRKIARYMKATNLLLLLTILRPHEPTKRWHQMNPVIVNLAGVAVMALIVWWL